MATGWHRDGPPARPIAAPLARCAELLDVDLAQLHQVAAGVEPYRRADGEPVWSLRLLERALHPPRGRLRYRSASGGAVLGEDLEHAR